ncbi:MAG: NAD(P)-dependent glycerol-3-phosphate dehydrogenase [Alphaproteobacteria bacterium]|nr:NAD(P)-dependent glycerol-3-phosphate dehydrogenase [Alphaproteobacteria bacterium]MDE2336481.1 NAD(P)-dependent glycerol-3-phosphate dehydrogenase [Alphaproteobacteria bacterium]
MSGSKTPATDAGKISLTGAGKISVIGAGAWGTALAQMLATAGRAVTLYAREAALAAEISTKHANSRYLAGIPLDPAIRATAALAEAAEGAEMVLLATPAQFARGAMAALHPHLPPDAAVVNCAKGIEIKTGKLLSEAAAETLPENPYAVLSGPTFAHEIARGLPAAVTFATKAPAARAARWAQMLSAKAFRPYLSSDVAGAEIAGAVKNVIAIACGIVEGKGLGLNARAAVMTRGLAEMKRLGCGRGADAETFLGLSGLGDLALTCNAMASRNFSLGFALGRGEKLEDVLAGRASVAEGVATARAIALNATAFGVEMPISAAVDGILHHAAPIDAVIARLMERDLKTENL